MKQLLKFTLNGENVETHVYPDQMLVSVIRDDLHMYGTKKGCEVGECGACTVIMDGKAITSCITPALKAQGTVVETIEGIGNPDNLHPIQKSFVENNALQCGYCIPGIIMSAKALLSKNQDPAVQEVRTAISGNICRCTGYVKIEKAILDAAKEMRKGGI